MLGRQSAPVGSAPPLVFGCLSEPARQRRIQAALRTFADVRWFTTFADMRDALQHEPRRVHVVVIELVDPSGASGAAFASALNASYRGIGVVAYRLRGELTDAALCMLGAAGVHDTLVEGLTDSGYAARTIILDACKRGAVDQVIAELRALLPARLMVIAEAALRDPANCTVRAVSRYLNIHRQTPSGWCRKEHFPRPEELLVWCRLLLVAALLELTPRTLESIAVELEYSSPTALRNQLKRYTGLTSTRVREEGLQVVLAVFRGRVAQYAAGLVGQRSTGEGATQLHATGTE